MHLDIANHKIWKLYLLIRNQVLRAGMDGTVVGLNLHAACEILKFHGEGEKMLDEILFCWNLEQEVNK